MQEENRRGRFHPFFQNCRDGPQVIAHRGGGGEWPGETIYAFKQAVKRGVDILELDIRSTKDGYLMLMHNASLMETTGYNAKIHKMDAAVVHTKDAAHWWRIRGLNLPTGPELNVPKLDDVLSLFRDQRIVIEIKPWHFPQALILKLGQLIRHYNMQQNVLIASGWHRHLRRFRREFSEIATSASVLEMILFRYLRIRPNADAIQTISRMWKFERINEKFVKRAHDSNLIVDGWTVNHAEEMGRLVEADIDGIITDQPSTLMILLDRYKDCR